MNDENVTFSLLHFELSFRENSKILMVDHREELLRESCALGNLEAVQKFIEAGVDVNSQNKVNKWTALHWSAHRGHFKIVKYLLDHGGDPSITNFDGKTAIDLASNEVKELFGIKIKDDEIVEKKDEFKPNYLLYPELIASVSVPSDAVLRPSGDNPVEKNDSTQSQMYDILVMSINGDLLGSIKVSDSDKITDVIQKLKQVSN
ncbi:ankyrin [Rozella allomycis CSF55]|uniref:Ankyrin n=1 Tax=Rozella allomycis (strain CSF55) TaxID=988480 RepID=A0A075AMP9_ROZAC|nr:hypothetical protein O9G_002795 [Rozella allomycis CSF55]RKP16792.1 ankyrin [Rozella allomycis CSF55]|eukprot:EPZ30918.1 hypothetical protein O9G_002795 [Rozella allomycis CSF55]